MNNDLLFEDEFNPRNIISLDKCYSDTRGVIQSIINKKSSNVSIITSKKLTIRSNHYHLTKTLYMYTLSGQYYYFYKSQNPNEF